MNDIITQIFNEVIAIFNINEKDADERGLWKKFEVSLKQLISQSERQVDEKYIKEKAREFYEAVIKVGSCAKNWIEHDEDRYIREFKRIIQQVIQEIQKPKITPNIPHELDVIKDHFIAVKKGLDWIVEYLIKKKPKASKEFVEKWAQELINADNTPSMPITFIKRILKEAGCEVEE